MDNGCMSDKDKTKFAVEMYFETLNKGEVPKSYHLTFHKEYHKYLEQAVIDIYGQDSGEIYEQLRNTLVEEAFSYFFHGHFIGKIPIFATKEDAYSYLTEASKSFTKYGECQCLLLLAIACHNKDTELINNILSDTDLNTALVRGLYLIIEYYDVPAGIEDKLKAMVNKPNSAYNFITLSTVCSAIESYLVSDVLAETQQLLTCAKMYKRHLVRLYDVLLKKVD